jgi:hypothetical protein
LSLSLALSINNKQLSDKNLGDEQRSHIGDLGVDQRSRIDDLDVQKRSSLDVLGDDQRSITIDSESELNH